LNQELFLGFFFYQNPSHFHTDWPIFEDLATKINLTRIQIFLRLGLLEVKPLLLQATLVWKKNSRTFHILTHKNIYWLFPHNPQYCCHKLSCVSPHKRHSRYHLNEEVTYNLCPKQDWKKSQPNSFFFTSNTVAVNFYFPK
jgi:hypothetical protein